MPTALWSTVNAHAWHFTSGWLSRNWYPIRMSYDNVIMSSGWHALPFLSHPDEKANFDFPQHAVALQRFRSSQPLRKSHKIYACPRWMNIFMWNEIVDRKLIWLFKSPYENAVLWWHGPRPWCIDMADYIVNLIWSARAGPESVRL